MTADNPTYNPSDALDPYFNRESLANVHHKNGIESKYPLCCIEEWVRHTRQGDRIHYRIQRGCWRYKGGPFWIYNSENGWCLNGNAIEVICKCAKELGYYPCPDCHDRALAVGKISGPTS